MNAFGEHLAEETGEALSTVPFDVAYTSPLKRARRTAELVLGDRNVPILDEKRIEEMGFGIYEGLICKEEASEIPDPEFFQFFHAPEKYRPKRKGTWRNPFEEMSCKGRGIFLEELRQDPARAGQTILIATHGAALCALLCHMKGADVKDFWGTGVHKNCAVTIVDVTPEEYRIVEEGKTYYTEEVKPW